MQIQMLRERSTVLLISPSLCMGNLPLRLLGFMMTLVSGMNSASVSHNREAKVKKDKSVFAFKTSRLCLK